MDEVGNPDLLSWSQTTVEGEAALRWWELGGEYSLVMVHTTIEKAADLQLPKGITKALPFLVPPAEGWNHQDPELEPYKVGGDTLMIPPRRVAAFVKQFAQSQFGPGFGTHNPSGTPTLRYASPGLFPNPALATDKTDERQPWIKSVWGSSPHGLDYFDSQRLGYESVMQMAMEHAKQEDLTFDQDAIDSMLKEIEQHHAFEVYVQVIGVRPSTGPGERIKLEVKRFTRIRHHSLQASLTQQCELSLGPPRHVISPLNESHYLYLAPRDDRMHILFPFPVSFYGRPAVLRAYVPTSTGYVLLPQLVDYYCEDDSGVRTAKGPNIAQFQVPSNATSGWVWIEDARFPGFAVEPMGSVSLDGGLYPAVWITAYE